MNHVVCGWYTPDYSAWVPALKASLDLHGQLHDLVEVAHGEGGWEANTRRKPFEMWRAIQRNAGKVVIFVDVDCVVRGDLTPLAELGADVGLWVRGQRRSGGRYGLSVRSGTVVLKPTRGAANFVERWMDAARDAKHGDVDQTSLTLVMGECTSTSFQPIGDKYCGVKNDPNAVILHGRASANVSKISKWRRWLQR